MNRSIRLFPRLMMCVVLALSAFLQANQIVLDNLSDGNSTTLYGKGEIGLTTDKDELPPGNTIMTKKFDPLNDHTAVSGYSLELENYLIDSYGGVYLNVTSDIVTYPYINGSVYRDLSFYLKNSTVSTDWSLDITDWDNIKVRTRLGAIPQGWTKFGFDLITSTNISLHINITNIKALVFINTKNNSAGSLWIDDIVFDDLQFQDMSPAGNGNQVSLSEQKIYPNNQAIRLNIIPYKDSTITIRVCQSDGREVFTLPVSSQPYSGGQGHLFVWDGRDNRGTMMRNGIYFLTIRIKNALNEEKIVKPVGIFQ
jgi:hypothetical protein